LPLVRGNTVMVPRSAWEVCVMSVREKERLMAAVVVQIHTPRQPRPGRLSGHIR
jgi:hypothetical protein